MSLFVSLQEPSLLTVKAILILDNDGKRIVCKVSSHTLDRSDAMYLILHTYIYFSIV